MENHSYRKVNNNNHNNSLLLSIEVCSVRAQPFHSKYEWFERVEPYPLFCPSWKLPHPATTPLKASFVVLSTRNSQPYSATNCTIPLPIKKPTYMSVYVCSTIFLQLGEISTTVFNRVVPHPPSSISECSCIVLARLSSPQQFSFYNEWKAQISRFVI